MQQTDLKSGAPGTSTDLLHQLLFQVWRVLLFLCCLPGIMPIMTYGGFKRMTAFCKTKVPQDILDTVESLKDNEEAVRAYGIDLGVQMCKRLLEAGVPGLHMYSLNTDKSVMGILSKLGIIDTSVVSREGMSVLARAHTKSKE